VEIVASYF